MSAAGHPRTGLIPKRSDFDMILGLLRQDDDDKKMAALILSVQYLQLQSEANWRERQRRRAQPAHGPPAVARSKSEAAASGASRSPSVPLSPSTAQNGAAEQPKKSVSITVLDDVVGASDGLLPVKPEEAQRSTSRGRRRSSVGASPRGSARSASTGPAETAANDASQTKSETAARVSSSGSFENDLLYLYAALAPTVLERLLLFPLSKVPTVLTKRRSASVAQQKRMYYFELAVTLISFFTESDEIVLDMAPAVLPLFTRNVGFLCLPGFAQSQIEKDGDDGVARAEPEPQVSDSGGSVSPTSGESDDSETETPHKDDSLSVSVSVSVSVSASASKPKASGAGSKLKRLEPTQEGDEQAAADAEISDASIPELISPMIKCVGLLLQRYHGIVGKNKAELAPSTKFSLICDDWMRLLTSYLRRIGESKKAGRVAKSADRRRQDVELTEELKQLLISIEFFVESCPFDVLYAHGFTQMLLTLSEVYLKDRSKFKFYVHHALIVIFGKLNAVRRNPPDTNAADADAASTEMMKKRHDSKLISLQKQRRVLRAVLRSTQFRSALSNVRVTLLALLVNCSSEAGSFYARKEYRHQVLKLLSLCLQLKQEQFLVALNGDREAYLEEFEEKKRLWTKREEKRRRRAKRRSRRRNGGFDFQTATGVSPPPAPLDDHPPDSASPIRSPRSLVSSPVSSSSAIQTPRGFLEDGGGAEEREEKTSSMSTSLSMSSAQRAAMAALRLSVRHQVFFEGHARHALKRRKGKRSEQLDADVDVDGAGEGGEQGYTAEKFLLLVLCFIKRQLEQHLRCTSPIEAAAAAASGTEKKQPEEKRDDRIVELKVGVARAEAERDAEEDVFDDVHIYSIVSLCLSILDRLLFLLVRPQPEQARRQQDVHGEYVKLFASQQVQARTKACVTILFRFMLAYADKADAGGDEEKEEEILSIEGWMREMNRSVGEYKRISDAMKRQKLLTDTVIKTIMVFYQDDQLTFHGEFVEFLQKYLVRKNKYILLYAGALSQALTVSGDSWKFEPRAQAPAPAPAPAQPSEPIEVETTEQPDEPEAKEEETKEAREIEQKPQTAQAEAAETATEQPQPPPYSERVLQVLLKFNVFVRIVKILLPLSIDLVASHWGELDASRRHEFEAQRKQREERRQKAESGMKRSASNGSLSSAFKFAESQDMMNWRIEELISLLFLLADGFEKQPRVVCDKIIAGNCLPLLVAECSKLYDVCVTRYHPNLLQQRREGMRYVRTLLPPLIFVVIRIFTLVPQDELESRHLKEDHAAKCGKMREIATECQREIHLWATHIEADLKVLKAREARSMRQID